MKKRFLVFVFLLCLSGGISYNAAAQCSICTRTAQQLGEKPATGMNKGILYLAFMPMAVIGVISYKWWRNNRAA